MSMKIMKIIEKYCILKETFIQLGRTLINMTCENLM